MSVYIVLIGDTDEYYIKYVFSTREAAQSYIDTQEATWLRDYYYIEKHKVIS